MANKCKYCDNKVQSNSTDLCKTCYDKAQLVRHLMRQCEMIKAVKAKRDKETPQKCD